MEEGSTGEEEPDVNSFSCPDVSFTFPEEAGGKSLRMVPGGVRASDGAHVGT